MLHDMIVYNIRYYTIPKFPKTGVRISAEEMYSDFDFFVKSQNIGFNHLRPEGAGERGLRIV